MIVIEKSDCMYLCSNFKKTRVASPNAIHCATGVVYEVCDESEPWLFNKEIESLDLYLRVKTAQGLLEFKCKSKSHKQKWIDGIQKLLDKTSLYEDTEGSMTMLRINKSF